VLVNFFALKCYSFQKPSAVSGAPYNTGSSPVSTVTKERAG